MTGTGEHIEFFGHGLNTEETRIARLPGQNVGKPWRRFIAFAVITAPDWRSGVHETGAFRRRWKWKVPEAAKLLIKDAAHDTFAVHEIICRRILSTTSIVSPCSRPLAC